MAVQISATVDGLGGLGAAFGRMAALGASPRPIFAAIANYGESSTRLRFTKQVGPGGQRWKPSARAAATGGKTLVASARLLRSITHRADNSGAEWGTNVKYAGIHQFGGEIKAKGRALRFKVPGGGFVTVKKVTMPARPFMGVDEADGREILALATDAVDLAARNRGGA